VFTKCSLLAGPDRRVVHNLKRDSILREAENSLERLRIDAIDLYQIHWPIPEEDIEEGWGRSSSSAAERELLPFAESEGTGVIVYSPRGSGMLTGA
jgi:aryl-alcohol dehydrogenase-like predicted oxidoreductase